MQENKVSCGSTEEKAVGRRGGNRKPGRRTDIADFMRGMVFEDTLVTISWGT